VIYPALELVRASLGRYSITGLYQGAVVLRNYGRLQKNATAAESGR